MGEWFYVMMGYLLSVANLGDLIQNQNIVFTLFIFPTSLLLIF